MVSLVVVAAVAAAAVGGVVVVLRHLDRPAPVVEACSARLDGTSWVLAPDQADSAATIAAVTVRRGLPAHAATIALATAAQESKLRNIAYGDRDSVGLFQQRPSQGWGTPDQLQDPVYATNAFLDVLVKVDGWRDLSVTRAAQKVQRSAFPDAYGQHEAQARAWASALTGYSENAVTCTLRPVDDAGPAGDDAVTAFTRRLDRDLGDLPVARTGAVVTVDARGLAGTAAHDAWAVGQWAVAVADGYGVDRVEVADRVWTRASGAWQDVATADAGHEPGAGRARVTLVAPAG